MAYEAAQRTALSRGAWVDPRSLGATVAEVAAEWLRSNPAKRASTLGRDESALRLHVVPAIGHRKVGSLTPADMRALVGTWSGQMASRSVRRTYGTLRAVLNFAVETDRLVRSPCRAIHLPAVDAHAGHIVTGDELRALALAMPRELSAMVWLGAVLGLRWGEVAGLRVGRVDLLPER